MAYEPTTWDVGDVITAEKMNNIEDGIQEAAGGGYDAEITIYKDNNSAHDPVITIAKGDFETLYEMVSNHVPPTILVRYWNDATGVRAVTSAVAIYAYESTYIVFAAQLPGTSATSSVVSDRLKGVIFNWYSNDTIEL